jgi:hypothetical protein
MAASAEERDNAFAGQIERALNSRPFDMDLSNGGLNNYRLPRHVLKRLMNARTVAAV